MIYSALLLIAFCNTGSFAQDVPFFPRDMKANQDQGAANQNEHELAVRPGSKLTQTVTPNSCPAGQSLTGAVFQHGQVWGGACTPAVTATTNTYSGSNIFSSSVTFNGGIFGQVANSSCTVVPTTSLGSSSLAVGVATVTFTNDTSRLIVWYTGGLYHGAAGVNNGISLLVNGAYPSGLSDTVAVKSCSNVQVNGAPFDCSIPGYPITVTPGSNRFTLTAATKSGTLTIPPGGGNASFNTQAYFCVGEYK